MKDTHFRFKRQIFIFVLSLMVFFFSHIAYLMAQGSEGIDEGTANVQGISSKQTNWVFYSGAHLRTSFNRLANTVYLDKHNHNDHNTYLGYAYDFTLDLRHKSGTEIYTFIERRGRADYDAPLVGERQIDTLFGRYHWYHDSNMTPRIREFWTETPLNSSEDLNFKIGLYPYGREVGHRIALGGKYENYGITLSSKNESCDWNLHLEREDINNRIHLGRVVEFDKVNRYNETQSYFYAGDAAFKLGKQKAQVYLGWLRDDTANNSRNSKFNSRVKEEDLITPGTYINLHYGKLSLGFEGARNFGRAKSIDTNRWVDVKHKGYLLIGDASYDLGSFKPKTKIFVASGNKFNEGNVNDLTINSGTNRAFSVFSPLNANLTDSHYQKQFGPYVAMAGGYAVNFGISRPGTFGDPFIFENLIAYTLGFDYTPLDKWYIGIDYWYLKSKENGYGLDEKGVVKKLPNELGHEIDAFISYQVTKNTKLSLLTGYFIPGEYYRQSRTDTKANNIFAPTPRRDGRPDNAYQIELGLDIKF